MISMIKRMREHEEGFTLVELLVVILIIGILLAIALPTFLNQQDKANDTAAKQNLNTAYKVAKSESVDHQGKYTQGTYTADSLAAAISASEPELKGVVATNTTNADAAADSNGVVVVTGGADGTAGDSLKLVAKSNSNGGTYCSFTVSGNVPEDGGPQC